MNRVRLQESSPEFSALAFGTWRVMEEAATASPAGLLEVIKAALEVGITTLDTAEIYGGYQVEELLGAALALDPGVRQKVEIISKAGIYVPNSFHPDRRFAHYNGTAARLVKSVEKSLRFLGVETLDCFLVHRPDWLAEVDDTAAGLNQLLQEGKIRSAGVSNYSPSQFAALSSRVSQPLVTNQVEFHLLHMTPILDGTLDQCQQFRFRPMAWSPMAGGRLFDEADPAARRLRTAVEAMGPRYGGATLDQLALAWILAHPSRPLPVLGTSRVSRVQSAAQATHLELSREDWYGLWEAAMGNRIP